jgi:hypothetical protein
MAFSALLVGLLVSACFVSQSYWYTNFDDEYNFASVKTWTLYWIWWDGEVLGVYEPVANTLKLLLFGLFGEYALTVKCFAIGLQCFNSACCFAITCALLKDFKVPTIVCGSACLFVCSHPLRVEVVSWCSGMPYLLATSWLYLFLFLYTQGRAWQQEVGWRAQRAHFLLLLSAVAYAFAILSKATAVPGILLAYAWEVRHFRADEASSSVLFHYGKAIQKCLEVCFRRTYLGVSALLAVAILLKIRLVSLDGRAASHSLQLSLSFEQSVLRATHMPVAYVLQTFWPVPLSCRNMLDKKEELSFVNLYYSGSAVGVVALTLLAVHVFLRNSCYGSVDVDSDGNSDRKKPNTKKQGGEQTQAAPEIKTADISAPSQARLLASLWLLYIGLLSPTLGVVGAEHIQVSECV